MTTSRVVGLALAVSVCGLLSMLAVTAVSDEAAPVIAPRAVTATAPQPPPPSVEPAPEAVFQPPVEVGSSPATSPSAFTPPSSYVPPPGPSYGPPRSYPATLPDPNKAAVTLRDGSMLIGELAVPAELKIKTEYGELSVSRKLVSGICWGGLPDKAVVHLCNGDRLTGKLEMTAVRLKAVWGEVSIDPQHVVCVNWGGRSGPYTPAYRPPSRRGATPYYPSAPSTSYSTGTPAGVSNGENLRPESDMAPESSPSTTRPEHSPNAFTVPMVR